MGPGREPCLWGRFPVRLIVFLGAMGYLILMYNGLVDVRNRMKRSWSLIDIQLKRRADLIPRLAECVKGFTRHENEVQTALAEMRSTGAITMPTGAPTNEEIQAGVQATMARITSRPVASPRAWTTR